MNFPEAMKQLIAGNKVKRKVWTGNSHLHWVDGMVYIGSMKFELHSLNVIANDWEVVLDYTPKKFWRRPVKSSGDYWLRDTVWFSSKERFMANYRTNDEVEYVAYGPWESINEPEIMEERK